MAALIEYCYSVSVHAGQQGHFGHTSDTCTTINNSFSPTARTAALCEVLLVYQLHVSLCSLLELFQTPDCTYAVERS